MVIWCNHPSNHFSLTIHFLLASFYEAKYFLKKNWLGEMLIEQIIEFKLRWPGPHGRTYIPTTGYFHDKTKICKETLQVDYYFLLKCCRRQCTLLPPTWAKSLTRFNPKMQNFKRVLDLNCKLKED